MLSKFSRWRYKDEDINKLISNQNKNFAQYLNNHMIKTSYEYKLGKKSYDIAIVNKNILIEINPTYTHNSTSEVLLKGKGYSRPKDRYYHYNKTKEALLYNFICLQKFDWVTDNEILRLIRNVHRYSFEQEDPRLHWYNIERQDHIEDFQERLNKVDMISRNYLEVYDDGLIIKK